jgi:hydrogenase maturation protease
MSGGHRIVVIGVGNEYRADDGAGLAVLGALSDVMPAGVEVVHSDGEPASLLEAWTGAATAIVVDAVTGGTAAPGMLHRVELLADRWPSASGPVLADRGASSHDLGVGSAVALARALDRMPGRLIVHGIQGADFGHGAALSPPIAARISELAATVLADVRAAAGSRSP